MLKRSIEIIEYVIGSLLHCIVAYYIKDAVGRYNNSIDAIFQLNVLTMSVGMAPACSMTASRKQVSYNSNNDWSINDISCSIETSFHRLSSAYHQVSPRIS